LEIQNTISTTDNDDSQSNIATEVDTIGLQSSVDHRSQLHETKQGHERIHAPCQPQKRKKQDIGDDDNGVVIAFDKGTDKANHKMESSISVLSSGHSMPEITIDEIRCRVPSHDGKDSSDDETSSCRSSKTSVSTAVAAVFESVFASLSTKFPKYQQQCQSSEYIGKNSTCGAHYIRNTVGIKELQQCRPTWNSATSSSSSAEVVDQLSEDDASSCTSIISSSNGSFYDKVWRINDKDIICKVISIPPGKMGIAVDSTLKDGPIVVKVSENSPLFGSLLVGDRIIAMNSVNTRSMSSAALTSLMLNTLEMSSTRQFTVLRHLGSTMKASTGLSTLTSTPSPLGMPTSMIQSDEAQR
jgi:hypothetical protein